MDLLNAMRHFTAIADAKSFSQAAARLRISNATISQSIKNLEDHLGVRLLNRNTRHVTLTDEGRRYDERCRAALAEIDEIQLALADSRDRVCGSLRVELPYTLGRSHILPHLHRFTNAYPNLELTILLNPGSGRLIEEGIDVALQIGILPASSLISRRVYRMIHLACAAPSYLARHGVPQMPGDLKAHACIGFWSPNTSRLVDWQFERHNAIHSHTPRGPAHFNSSEAAIELARAGGGIIYMPDLLVADDLRAGRLVQVLSGWYTVERPVYLVYPERRHVPTKVRAFADFIDSVFIELAAQKVAA